MWSHWPHPSICTLVIETYSSTLCVCSVNILPFLAWLPLWGVLSLLSAGGIPVDHSQHRFSAVSLLASSVYAIHSFSRATKHFFSPSCFLMASHTTRQTGWKGHLVTSSFACFGIVLWSLFCTWPSWGAPTNNYKQMMVSQLWAVLCWPVLDKRSSVEVSSHVCNRLKFC